MIQGYSYFYLVVENVEWAVLHFFSGHRSMHFLSVPLFLKLSHLSIMNLEFYNKYVQKDEVVSSPFLFNSIEYENLINTMRIESIDVHNSKCD